MKTYYYKLECPICGKTYDSGHSFVIATSVENAINQVRGNHQSCPISGCAFPSDLTIKISVE